MHGLNPCLGEAVLSSWRMKMTTADDDTPPPTTTPEPLPSLPPRSSGGVERQRWVEGNARLSKISSIAAVVVSLFTMAASFNNLRHVLVIAVVQMALITINTWTIVSLAKSRGPVAAEAVRTVANMTGWIATALLTNFALSTWLWVPFAAFNFDHISRRTAVILLGVFALVQDVLALHSGVYWLVPLIFTSLAFLCFAFTQARAQVISDMLAESDKQHDALMKAHEEIQAQHVEMMEQARVREAMELELRHSHKLEAIGRLAAGIAHEINTPVQFVGDGVQFISDGTRDLLSLIAAYRMAGHAALEGRMSITDLHEDALKVEEEFDLEYLAENLPKATARTLDGLNRIATIVQSMKEFAHPDQKKQTRLDINRAIASTVTIAAHEYRMVADVELHLGECPHVMCHASEVNQVFLNVLVNAAHAIRDVVRGTDKKGKIRITTGLEGTSAVIKISDNGGGIPNDIRERIFEPFFTTKEVGMGTGQGLAIAHKVVKGHGGTITCASTEGRGTTFTIKLPVGLKTPLAIPSPFGAAA